MSEPTIRTRVEAAGELLTVRILIQHPMEVGEIPPVDGVLGRYITTLTVHYGAAELLTAHWGPGIARNPLLVLRTPRQENAALLIRWQDNRGAGDELQVPVEF